MKEFFKDFIPPVIVRGLKKMKPGTALQKFGSYEDALKLCTKDAYEEDELVQVIFKKTKRFRDQVNLKLQPIQESAIFGLVSMINPIIDSKGGVINVLDFGGACGAHYFQVRSIIDKALKLNWVVVETPGMVKYAKGLEQDELHFFSDFDEALQKIGRVDLLHTSGTLQCVDDPSKYLSLVLSAKAKWILFNRLGLNRIDRKVITIHGSLLSWNGIGELPEGHKGRWVKYPFVFMSEKSFMESVEASYSTIAKFTDTSGMYPVQQEDITGYGLLCKSKLAD